MVVEYRYRNKDGAICEGVTKIPETVNNHEAFVKSVIPKHRELTIKIIKK